TQQEKKQQYAEEKVQQQQQQPIPSITTVAAYDYVGEDSQDLTFRAGDIIHDVKEIDANWYKGTIAGRSGIFPKTYVKIINKPATAPPSLPPRNRIVLVQDQKVQQKPSQSKQIKHNLIHSTTSAVGWGFGMTVGRGIASNL